jgi:ABC-type polysaccharide/polyol phosphate transport system ATPase subunit
MSSLRKLKSAFSEGLYVEKSALHDITFSVEKGENVGILGGNGSGKSTLLKVIAGNFPPSSGVVKTEGAIAPLMDLGAGFHPELSTRDNIILNATLLKHRTIDPIQIASWANLSEQINDPIRTFSAGMVARLAFSIATSAEPDILLVDEVLSVGDEAFQVKSLARMKEMMNSNKTIILVTHNLKLLEEQCDRLIWLDQGKIVEVGDPDTLIKKYLLNIQG